MDWADIVLFLFSQPFMALMSVAVFVLSVAVWRCRREYLVSGYFFFAIGLAVLGVAVFYVGAIVGYEDPSHGQAASRISFVWLLVIIGAVLYSLRCKNGKNGDGA